MVVLVAVFGLTPSGSSAQEHLYQFHYRPVNPPASIRYLYDWCEVEPDGWIRRDMIMYREE